MQDNKCTKWCKISSHKRQSYQKHNWVFRKIFNFDSKWETPSIQNLWLQCQDLRCTVSHPLKNFMDNPPTHNEKEKHTSPCLFSHNKGMNTMICVLQPLFSPLLSSTRPHVYSKVRLPAERVSYGRVILRTRFTRAFVRSPNWRQDSGWRTCCIVGCVQLTCNKIQNWFAKMTGVCWWGDRSTSGCFMGTLP